MALSASLTSCSASCGNRLRRCPASARDQLGTNASRRPPRATGSARSTSLAENPQNARLRLIFARVIDALNDLSRRAERGEVVSRNIGSRRPLRRQRLGLLQDFLHRRILQVGRIAVFAKQTLHQNPHPGASRLPVHPVHRDIALDARHQLVAMTRSAGSPMTCRALSFSASAS